MTVADLLTVLRAATPEDHPFLGYDGADEKGALFAAFLSAAADLVEGAQQTDSGLAFAQAVSSVVADMIGATE